MKAHLKSWAYIVVTGTIIACPVLRAADQVTPDALAPARTAYRADRTAYVAEMLQLTDAEGKKFWPVYRKYAASKEAIGDSLVKLVLEYADAYPNVPEERARQLLQDYSRLENDLSKLKASYRKKFSKTLSATKALRLAQVENRVDTVLRMQLASAVPLLPVEGRLTASSVLASTVELGTPGGSIVQVRELTATVIGINKASRKIALMSADGIKQMVKVGPEAINFDQIRIGDKLRVVVTEELVVALAGADEVIDQGAAELVALSPEGAKPGGLVAETTQVTATIASLDKEKHTATVRFVDGSTQTFPVRQDVDLGKRKVGEKVVFTATEMVALRVTKP